MFGRIEDPVVLSAEKTAVAHRRSWTRGLIILPSLMGHYIRCHCGFLTSLTHLQHATLSQFSLSLCVETQTFSANYCWPASLSSLLMLTDTSLKHINGFNLCGKVRTWRFGLEHHHFLFRENRRQLHTATPGMHDFIPVYAFDDKLHNQTPPRLCRIHVVS